MTGRSQRVYNHGKWSCELLRRDQQIKDRRADGCHRGMVVFQTLEERKIIRFSELRANILVDLVKMG